MPEIARLKDQRTDIATEYDAKLAALDDQLAKAWADVQLPANTLLLARSEELVRAVAHSFREIGLYAIVVDDVRSDLREEDLWVATASIETPAVDASHIVEVKGYANRTCSDDDYGALLKYLNRRAREWKRNDLRGMLVVNHAHNLEPSDRPQPFSESQIGDAERDGIGLLSSDVLFEIGRQVRSGTLAASDAQRIVLTTDGRITA